jgi:hypothetical protein
MRMAAAGRSPKKLAREHKIGMLRRESGRERLEGRPMGAHFGMRGAIVYRSKDFNS